MYRKRNAIKAYMIKHIEYACMCLRQNGSQWGVWLGKVHGRIKGYGDCPSSHDVRAIISNGNTSPTEYDMEQNAAK